MDLDRVFQETWWQIEVLGNTLQQYATALLIFFGGILVLGLLRYLLFKRFERLAKATETDVDDLAVQVVKTLRPPFYTFIAFYVAIRYLEFTGLVDKIVTAILLIWITYQVIRALQIILDFLLHRKVPIDDENTRAAVDLLGSIGKLVLWVLGALLVLSNLGVDVTSFIAGLGISGIAVALALQNILGDLFSSFAIYFDKPFMIGDFIVVGDKMGTVEKIGIKTTRLRALQGEELVLSNRDLTSAEIQNYGDMQERRDVISFGVTYETPSEQLRRIPEMAADVVHGLDLARLDHAHFKQFGDSALEYEVIYYTTSADYNEFLETREAISSGILERLRENDIEMAYPTQTVYLTNVTSS